MQCDANVSHSVDSANDEPFCLLAECRSSVSELRHPAGWRRRRQGAVPAVHAAVCGHTGGHSREQQVHTSQQHQRMHTDD